MTTFGASTHDVSIWGRCYDLGNQIDFCCVFDDNLNAITRVEINGTPRADEALSFVHNFNIAGEENLEPWDTDAVDGIIRGNAGADYIFGSDFSGGLYRENLWGGTGADILYGAHGDDKLNGGDDADWIEGNEGADILWGGDGDDDLWGNDGADTLCDASGYDVCATNHGNFMDGGFGEDKLWYDSLPMVPCLANEIDPASTAGSDTDDCGNTFFYTPTDLPLSCEATTASSPSACIGAF